VYFSPHKLVGGPGAPGVLVVKRRLLNIAKVPTQPGGGTVFFVTNKYAAAAHMFCCR
jgi:selenocysteine lyase/cysteine desulfurase